MANNLSVKITADIVDLQTKFAVARAEASGLTAEMNKLARASAAGTIDAGGSARMQQVAADMLRAKQNAAGLAQQLEQSGASFASFGSRVAASSGGIGGALESLQGKFSAALKFTGIGIAIAGIEQLAQAVSALGARAAEMRATADVLGVTVEQYQAMSAAADSAGVSSETLARFAERLVGMFQKARDGSGEAAEKLKLLGLTNQQIASTTFGVNDALGALHARLMDASTAVATQNEILAQFGPRGALAVEVLKRYSGSADEVAARMRDINGLNAEQAASASDAYAAYKEWGSWLANTFTKTLDATAMGVAKVAEVMLAPAAKMPALQMTIQVPSIAPQVQKDAATAQAALQTVEVTAHEVTQADLNALQQTVAAYQEGTAERLAAMRQLAAAAKEFYPTDQADKLLAIQRQLATEQRSYAEAQMRASQEATQKSIEASNIQKRLIDEQLAASEKYLSQEREITNADAESAIAIAKMKLQAQLEALNAEVAAHRMTAGQKLAVATELTRQLADLDKQQLENELAVQEPRTAAYERVANQIKEVNERLNLDLLALQKQFVQESAKSTEEQVKQWQKAVGEIENAEGQLVSDLLTRRKSLSQSLLAIGAQLVTQEIQNDIKAMTTKLLLATTEQNQEKALEQGGYLYHLLSANQSAAATQLSQTTQTAAVVAGNTARNTADASAAAVGRAQQAAIQGPSIMADAAKAFSGTYASVSSIPIVGWILAPAAAAAAFAAVAAYEGLASLDVGSYDVPRDMVAQIHRSEMVIPAPFAEGLRRSGIMPALAGAGGAQRSSAEPAGTGGGDTHFHVGISAWDGDSVGRWTSRPANQRVLARAVQAHARGLGYR